MMRSLQAHTLPCSVNILLHMGSVEYELNMERPTTWACAWTCAVWCAPANLCIITALWSTRWGFTLMTIFDCWIMHPENIRSCTFPCLLHILHYWWSIKSQMNTELFGVSWRSEAFCFMHSISLIVGDGVSGVEHDEAYTVRPLVSDQPKCSQTRS